MVMTQIRPAAVSGTFYPGDPDELAELVLNQLANSSPSSLTPKALIAPHAGYIYSGPIAASAYGQLDENREQISRVILLGPSHHIAFYGIALTDATHYQTPLGQIAIDQQAQDAIRHLSQVSIINAAHAYEHSLEVHLPFLQMLLHEFSLVPLVVGDCPPQAVAEALKLLAGGPETLIVVSSDLSHYHDYETAQLMDAETSQHIHLLNDNRIDGEHACGARPVNGLLRFVNENNMQAHILDVRNSGDTAGPRDRVVGYGAYAIT